MAFHFAVGCSLRCLSIRLCGWDFRLTRTRWSIDFYIVNHWDTPWVRYSKNLWWRKQKPLPFELNYMGKSIPDK